MLTCSYIGNASVYRPLSSWMPRDLLLNCCQVESQHVCFACKFSVQLTLDTTASTTMNYGSVLLEHTDAAAAL